MKGKLSYHNELELVQFLIDRLERQLAGRDEDRIVNRLPIDHCRLGVLVPSDRQVDEPEFAEGEPVEEPEEIQTVKVKKSAKLAKISEAPEREFESVEERETPSVSRRSPSALGMELRIRPEQGEIRLEVKVAFAIYTRHLPTFEEQRSSLGADIDPGEPSGSMTLAEVCRRWLVRVGPISLVIPGGRRMRLSDQGVIQAEVDRVLDQACAAPDAMPTFERVPEVPVDALANEESFQRWLDRIVQGYPRNRPPLRAALTLYADPQPNGTVRLRIYVQNLTPSNFEKRSEDYYHILGDVHLTVRVLQGEVSPVELLPIPEDYMYDRRVWAVGHNTSIEVSEDRRTFQTQALAHYAQPRVILRASEETRFSILSQEPLEALERIRREMEEFAQEWERKIAANDLSLDSDSLKVCRKDLEAFQEEIDRFAAGIAAMAVDSRLQEAFQAMNRVMIRVAQGRFDRWRLFQVVFIVSQLPALALREGYCQGEWPPGTPRRWDDHLEIGEVLWIPTGGGKTEAYLGLISCAILYDRLRGKERGVTAWLRLPLRMLSIQQLQRALRVIWETEKERQKLLKDKLDQSDPVRLGYFVGSAQTPNILKPGDIDKLSPEDLERYRVVPNCPACGGKDSVKVEPDRKNVRLRHRCTSCGEELPLLVSDSEIYRYLPALIVGTVDKIATIGLQRRFGILLHGPEWQCAHGYGRGKQCDFGCKGKQLRYVPVYDPAPALQIQDELHLLQEELGAFAGHYETLIRYLAEEVSDFPPKVIAATATIEGFEHQVQHLYGVRRARRFPARGYERYRSFYMELERDGDSVRFHRIFVGFRPPGGHPTDLTAWCAGVLLNAVAEMIQDPYRGLAICTGLEDESALRQLLEFYNIALVYVGNLAGGTRAKDYLVRLDLPAFESRELNVEYLSSRSTPAEITDVIQLADDPLSWEDEDHLDAVVATKMISHGVDFERINLMVLDHFPGEVAEYIQATSRCGRKRLGLVVTLLPAYSARASSIYNRFREFHDNLDRMVQPVPVNRFARRAIDRTFPGIFCGLMMVSEGLLRRDQVLEILGDPGKRKQVIAKLRKAYGLDRSAYDADLERMMAQALEQATEYQGFSLRTSHEKYLYMGVRPQPMRSLRDIEPGVPFQPSPEADDRLLRHLSQE